MEEKRELNNKEINLKEHIKKEVEMKENLILFNSDLEIIKVIEQSNIYLEENKYPNYLYYIETDNKTFWDIKMLLLEYTLSFISNPIETRVSLENIKKVELPPKPPTKAEAINNSLLGITMGVGNLNKQVNALSDGMLNEIEERATLKKQIAALNNTVLMLTMKLGGK